VNVPRVKTDGESDEDTSERSRGFVKGPYIVLEKIPGEHFTPPLISTPFTLCVRQISSVNLYSCFLPLFNVFRLKTTD
jgi:hypothetical protein